MEWSKAIHLVKQEKLKPLFLQIVIFNLGFLLFLPVQKSFAQQPEDTLRIYKNLDKKSKRWAFTRWLFETIVVMPKPAPKTINIKPVKLIKPFEAEQGKIIRKVYILVLDPFGYSVNDTARRPQSRLEKYANNVHVTSKKFLIKNQLLFNKGDSLDALKMAESERILRQAPYINDARILVKRLTRKQDPGRDSVDVWVYVQDLWSIFPESNFDPTQPGITLTDRNFLGLGTNIRQELRYKFSDNSVFVKGEYGIFNIRKLFLRTNLIYQISNELNQFGVQFERPFFSPLTRWAGGFSALLTGTYFNPFGDTALILRRFPIRFDVYDGWAGRSWQLKKANTIINRSTSIVAGIRIRQINFQQRPDFEIDPLFQNEGQTLVLGTIGISQRQFFKEKYLYRFGANEDVPIGFSFQLITGHQRREFQTSQFYSGASGAVGWYKKQVGYFAVQLSYGNFYNQNEFNKGIIRTGVNYFSNLIRYEAWAFRQFASLQTVFGLNRSAYEFIDLNGSQMYGFNSNVLRGKSKAILNLETVCYTPYNIFGFRIAPVFFMALGKIGDDIGSLLNSRIFQAYSIGLLVRNENLVFKTFELSIGIYPYMPGGNDGYRLNPVSSYTLRVRDFAIPKPEVLEYR